MAESTKRTTRSLGLAACTAPVVGVIAFIFSMFTIYGCGANAVLYGLVLLSLGLPVCVRQRRPAAKG